MYLWLGRIFLSTQNAQTKRKSLGLSHLKLNLTKNLARKILRIKRIYNTQCIGQETKVCNNDNSMDLISPIPEIWNYAEVEVH